MTCLLSKGFSNKDLPLKPNNFENDKKCVFPCLNQKSAPDRFMMIFVLSLHPAPVSGETRVQPDVPVAVKTIHRGGGRGVCVQCV